MAGVVVGYDGSDAARRALETAIEVANAYGDPLVVVFSFSISHLGGEVEDYARAVRERAEEVVRHAAHQAQGRGVEIETSVRAQDPAEGLVAEAAERDARVIVVGTRGESPLKGALVGSTPHRLLQISDRPVLVVPG
jgi:nucleotide-binding universal stress UspA family protein